MIADISDDAPASDAVRWCINEVYAALGFRAAGDKTVSVDETIDMCIAIISNYEDEEMAKFQEEFQYDPR